MVSEPIRTRLYLVRHCDVRNPKGVLYGHLPDFPLSDRGRNQAHALAHFFARTPVKKIYTSPLERARETTAIIASHLQHASVTETEELVEAHFGKYLQGVRPREVPWRRPLWLIHMVWPGLLPDDESVHAMAERVNRPLLRLLREHPGQGGICVSHGDPIQAFWVKAEGRPAHALHRLQCAKGGRLELDYVGERLVKLRYRPPSTVVAAEEDTALAGASHA